MALQWASEELKGDWFIVMAAMGQKGFQAGLVLEERQSLRLPVGESSS